MDYLYFLFDCLLIELRTSDMDITESIHSQDIHVVRILLDDQVEIVLHIVIIKNHRRVFHLRWLVVRF